MSNADGKPNQRDICRAASRRRAATRASTRAHRQRSRDACPQRQRLLDPDHEAFVDWFVTYWRRHGTQLFAGETTSTEA
jgi:hypothetical protein